MRVGQLVIPRSGPPVTGRKFGRRVLGCILLLLAACGTESAPRASPSPVQTSGSMATSIPGPTVPSPTFPGGLDRFTDPIDRLTYKLAYSDCQILSIQELSQAYGGDPGDPASVARAYAASAHASNAVPATQGCLDALQQPPGT